MADAGSRNGTLVNGAKVDEAVLVTGCKIRIGSTELEFFEEAEQARNEITVETINLAHTLAGEDLVTARTAFSALRDRKRLEELLDLYQLAYTCLTSVDSKQTIEMALDVIRGRTRATIVGYLSLDDQGKLHPQYILPAADAGRLKLSNRLTELVSRQATAIWSKNEKRRSHTDGALKHYADAICVPILQDKTTVGALHLYREIEQFEPHHFDFTISAATF